jgi:hypothetical protein
VAYTLGFAAILGAFPHASLHFVGPTLGKKFQQSQVLRVGRIEIQKSFHVPVGVPRPPGFNPNSCHCMVFRGCGHALLDSNAVTSHKTHCETEDTHLLLFLSLSFKRRVCHSLTTNNNNKRETHTERERVVVILSARSCQLQLHTC